MWRKTGCDTGACASLGGALYRHSAAPRSRGGRVLLDSLGGNPGSRPAQWVLLDSRRHGGCSWILVGTVGNPGSPPGSRSTLLIIFDPFSAFVRSAFRVCSIVFSRRVLRRCTWCNLVHLGVCVRDLEIYFDTDVPWCNLQQKMQP